MINRIYKAITFIGLAGVVIFMPLARGAVRTWSITPVLLIEAILIFLWLFKVNNLKGGCLFKRTELDPPILIFTILAASSFALSIYKHDSFYSLLTLLGYVGIYYIIVNEFDRSMIRRMMKLIISVAASISAYGLLQYLKVFDHSWWNPENFLAATYVNHNHFAGYLELVMPLLIGMLLVRRPRSIIYRLSLMTALILMIAAFVLTQSRGAWVSLSVSLLVMAVIISKGAGHDKKGVFILILFIIAIASFIYFGKDVVAPRIETITNAESGETSFNTRLVIWKGTVAMIKESPVIGTGIGTFIWAFNRFRPEGLNVQANFAHNDYLNMAAEMGIPAPIIMIWLIFIIIRTGISRAGLYPEALGCAIGVLSLSLHGLVDFNFHIPANMLLFTVWMAIVMRRER